MCLFVSYVCLTCNSANCACFHKNTSKVKFPPTDSIANSFVLRMTLCTYKLTFKCHSYLNSPRLSNKEML